jgi:D-sedoheptulose 7-phosphate isomerase
MNISDFVKKYNTDFSSLVNSIEVTSAGKSVSYMDGITKAVDNINEVQKNNKKVIMVGNGGSAGICSHQVVDYWKNGQIKSVAFNDSSLLTCIANDYSYADVFSVPIKMFADEGDIVYCISSSGKSQNIINAAKAAKEKKCIVITFSGFEKGNQLRQLGDINFFVGASSYGFVEILHLFIIHAILDAKMFCFDKMDIFNKNLPLAAL